MDGEAIEKDAFDHWMAVAAKSGGRTNDAERLRDQVLGLLVSQRWLEGEAEERGISVSESEVDEAFERRMNERFPKDSQFTKFLESSGQTEQDVRLRIRLDLLWTRISEQATRNKGRVTDKQVVAYYQANKARFGRPERRDVRIILTKTEVEAKRAKAALVAGRSWTAVARRFSIDRVSRSQDGKLTDVAEGGQDPALDAAIFRARKRTVTGPVKTGFGYYVFEVSQVAPASQQTLAQAEPTVRQVLVSERRQRALDDFHADFRRKWRERTECDEDYVTQDCNR